MTEKSTTTKHCQYCNKELFHGRSDKRFCNDTCRNAYNRNKAELEKKKVNELLPEILRIIKRNYEILLAYDLNKLGKDETLTVPQDELLTKGFNFKFYTSHRDSLLSDGFSCCFELCWKKDWSGRVILKCIPEQAVIE